MPTYLAYANANAAALDLKRAMSEQGIEPLMALPYNRFDPIKSLWWINPSHENPAYKHGKYALAPTLGDHEAFFCGMHIEKGFGGSAAFVMKSASEKRNLMGKDWLWHQFVSDLKAGSLDAPVSEMTDGLGKRGRLRVEAYYYKGGEFDPYATDEDWDFVEFLVDGAGVVADSKSTRVAAKLLDRVARATDLRSLGTTLEAVPNHEWVWINFWIGGNFELDPTDSAKGRWDAAKLWSKVLKPLRMWFL